MEVAGVSVPSLKVAPGGVVASNEPAQVHQQKVNAQHTNCQWRRIETSFLTW